MTKDEMHALAETGAAHEIADMERKLAIYHREWPQLFLSATPPQLLKAPLKNGNGQWPTTLQPARTYKSTSDQIAARREAMRAYVAEVGTAKMRDIRAHLHAQGISVSVTQAAKDLAAVGALASGGGFSATWSLKGGKTVPSQEAEGRARPARRRMSAAVRAKLAEAMRRRHANGDIARARARAKAKGNG